MGKFEQPRNQKPAKKTASRAAKKSGEKGLSGAVKALIVVVSVLAVAVIAFAAYAYSIHAGDKIFPNVSVAGVDVGGMTKEEAAAAIRESIAETYGSSTLTVKLPDRTLSFEPEDTKVSMDAEVAAQRAWEVGRDGGVIATLRAFMAPQSEILRLVEATDCLSLDEAYIRSEIDAVAADVASTLSNSSYEIVEREVPAAEEGQEPRTVPGELIIQVGTSQRSLDDDGLYEEVIAAFLANDFTPIEYAYEETLYAPVELDPIYDELCTDMANAYYDKEAKEIVPEVVGYGFDLAAASQQQAMAEEGSVLNIPLAPQEPEVTAAKLSETLFADVLASYDSPHTAIRARTNNLDLACKAIDGTILNAGEIFSFNDTVGERTAAKGYQAATVYVSGESRAELGGGVCQVSSTIYMCCVLADLNVVERMEHMYDVTYVPRGADATVYWGAVDFQFENSTDYPIRIDAKVEDGYCKIALVGTKTTDETIEVISVTTARIEWTDEEEVDETKPADYREVTQSPYTGYKATLYIQRKDADGNNIGERELAQYPYSTYRMRPRITTIGKQPEEGEGTGVEIIDPGTVTPDPGTNPVTPPVTPDPGTDPVTPPVTPDPGTDPNQPTTPTTPDPGTDPNQPTTPTTPEPEPDDGGSGVDILD